MWLKQVLNHRVWPALGQFLATGFMFLGLPLIAWGLNDLSGFLSNPVRTGFAFVVAVQAWTIAWLTYLSPPHPALEHHDNISRLHLHMFEAIFVLSAFGDRRYMLVWNENFLLRWAGIGIYLIGLALSLWANGTWVKHLRAAGESALANPVLLFDGPYKWIRYPSLVYLAFYCLGAAILFRSWVGLVLMPLLVGGIVNRVNNLDKIYAEKYKRIWPLRRHASKRLIPYLY